MKFSVKVNVAAFKQTLSFPVSHKIKDFLFDFRAKVAELFGGVKTGRFYRRPKPLTGTYRASAPGEPPAIASGRLLRSIGQPNLISPFKAELKITAPYAAILEGMEPSDRMEPRPFVQPALRAVTERFNSVEGKF